MKKHGKHGFVYVITNSWVSGLCKLGETDCVERRFKDISSSLPGKSELRWSKSVEHCFLLETKVRQALEPFRVRRSRDWFQLNWRLVVEQFEIAIAGDTSGGLIERLQINERTHINSAKAAGEFCRGWRRRSKVTQTELAAAAGVGVRFVSEFERGKPTCQIEQIIRVLQAVGIDIYAAKR